MDSKKKITISFRNEDQSESKREVVRTQYEQAATAEQEKKEDRSTTPVYELPVKKKKNQSSFKHLVMTSLTALVISLGLGFLLLRMFVTLTDDTTMENEATPVTKSATEQVPDAPSDPMSAGDAQSIDTYIVQAGAFSTEGKALEWQSRLIAQSIASVIWERNGQYFLFVGGAGTREEAEAIASQLTAKSIETYVKPWVVTVDEKAPSPVVEHLNSHSLEDLSESDRQGIMKEVEQNTPLVQALSKWESQDNTNINWLKVAKSIEIMD